MAKTARDIISSALLKIGVIASGETPSASELQDGLSALQNMIDVWSLNDLLTVSETQETFDLVQDKADYTIGSGGDFDTSRPVEILGVSVIESDNLEIPLGRLKFDQWRNIIVKTVQSTIPSDYYFRTGWPFATLFIYPVPSAVKQIIVYSRKPFLTLTDANDTVDLPPWYNDAIIYNLAVNLADEYGRAVTPNVFNRADKTLNAIKTHNLGGNVPYAATDGSLQGSAQKTGWTLADFLKGGG